MPNQLSVYRRRAGAVGFASAAAHGIRRYGPTVARRAGRALANAVRHYAPSARRYLNRIATQKKLRGRASRRVRSRNSRRARSQGRRRTSGGNSSTAIRHATRNYTSSRDLKLTLRDINDMMFPKLKETYQTSHPEIAWDSNQQGVKLFTTLYRGKVEEMWLKVHSNDVTTLNLAVPNTVVSSSSLMQICGGLTTYGFVNSCNHTIELTHYVFKPRRRLNASNNVQSCWERDLLNDNTLGNTVAPGNTERTTGMYGTPIIEASNRMSYVKWNWQQVHVRTYILSPGDTIKCYVKTDPFLYDFGKEAMAAAASADAYAADYGPYTRQSIFVAKSQLVVDNLGTSVAHGSGKLAMTEEMVMYWRAGAKVKRYQTVNHGSLDTIADANQYHFNEQTEAENVYDEA